MGRRKIADAVHEHQDRIWVNLMVARKSQTKFVRRIAIVVVALLPMTFAATVQAQEPIDLVEDLKASGTNLAQDALFSFVVPEGEVDRVQQVLGTGSTTSYSRIEWAPDVVIPPLLTPSTEAAVVPLSLDSGTYRQTWVIMFDGNQFCHETSATIDDAWSAVGTMYLRYDGWSFSGTSSSGSGSRPSSIGYWDYAFLVSASGDSKTVCESFYNFDKTTLKNNLVSVFAPSHFGTWKGEPRASTSWRLGAVATCLGPVLLGSETLSDTGGRHFFEQGEKSPVTGAAAGTHRTTGQDTLLDQTLVIYTGYGDLDSLCNIVS